MTLYERYMADIRLEDRCAREKSDVLTTVQRFQRVATSSRPTSTPTSENAAQANARSWLTSNGGTALNGGSGLLTVARRDTNADSTLSAAGAALSSEIDASRLTR